MLLVGTMGTVDAGSSDPFAEMSRLCSQYDMWFHVDAAYGGSYLMCPNIKEACIGMQCCATCNVM